MVLVDLRPKGLTGDITEVSLSTLALPVTKTDPFDPQPPMVTLDQVRNTCRYHPRL